MPESYKENGRPAQQWYWDDWFSAFDVRLCCLAARGLWIDMLGIMFKAEIRGTLTVNGKQPDNKTLAKIVGAAIAEIKPLLRELEMHNVFSRLDDGTIICRRMFRESRKKHDISKIRSIAGSKGARKRWQSDSKMIAKKICHSQTDMANDSKASPRNDSKEPEEKMAKMAASSPPSSSTPTSKSKTSCSEKPSEHTFKYSEMHKNLAKLLEAKIKERMPRHKFTGKQYLEEWANEFRLMEEKNEATIEEIEKLVIWVSKDDFWYKNIRSAEKLRKQFPRLLADREDKTRKGGKRNETSKEFTARMKKALEVK